ncbi:DUF3833 family protein [Aurantimonas sp. C2-6-R+9]|uniref:DUF3833 family protein n=2 Tax=Aurantimonas TaxID=182269 RepID=UPI002EAEEB7C|nr:DUF3833 family protein [Aurantimonas sp. C2-6-R+9]
MMRKLDGRRSWLWPTAVAGGAVILFAGLAWFAAPPRIPQPDPDGLSLPDFFAGKSVSKGAVTTALVFTEAFTAEFDGKQTGDQFQLDERFAFADGKRLQRWDLVRTAPGLYGGTVATELKTGQLAPPMPVIGVQTKNGAVLDYDGYAPGGGGTLLHFRHEMTGRPDGTVANHVIISKFGVPLATSDVTFAKSRAVLAPY